MPTPAELIKKFTELEDVVDAEQKAFDAWAKPYREAMETIRNAVHEEIRRLGVKNFPVEEVGTAYLSTTLSAKVDNRDAFLQFVTTNNRWNFLDARVLKEPVKDWLETGAVEPPPGIKIEYFTKCHIRRS